MRRLPPILVCLALLGCTGLQPAVHRLPPPPESEIGGAPPPEAPRAELPREAVAPPGLRKESRPQPRAAPRGPTAGLVASASRLQREGHLDAAAASLERALRITPDDAGLWQRLAEVRLAQGRPREAEPLALKSIQLAPDEARLRRRGWLLVARARRMAGDLRGAAEAEDAAARP